MKLKVIRYKNYGCTMKGPDDNGSDWEYKFYWSFYELNNGKTICLNITENWFKGKLVEPDFSYFYTKYELKNGRILSYNFGPAKANDANAMSKEFFDWFESILTKEQLKNELSPELTEEKCVRDFFEKNVENKKTSTILLGCK